MYVSPYRGRLFARAYSFSKEPRPISIGGLITNRSGLTCNGSPFILSILGHVLIISIRSRIVGKLLIWRCFHYYSSITLLLVAVAMWRTVHSSILWQIADRCYSGGCSGGTRTFAERVLSGRYPNFHFSGRYITLKAALLYRILLASLLQNPQWLSSAQNRELESRTCLLLV